MVNSSSSCSLLSSPESQSAVFVALGESEPNALLRNDAAEDISPIYGGLSRRQVLILIRTAQAGSIDPFAFMLAWARRLNRNPSPARLKALDAYFQEADDEPRMVYELWRAMRLLHGYPPGPMSREQVGHAKWWKIMLLEYMLQNPKPAYRTGEFADLLTANGLQIDPREIRAFCIKHNIARDSRPGRPTKKETTL